MREIAPDTVVIVISGAQTVESAVEALRGGAFDYVMKPFDLGHVEAAVRRALEHQSLRAAKRRYEIYLEEMVEQRTAELDRAVDSLEDAYRITLTALTAALEMRDHETHGHSERVVAFSLRLGRELGLGREQLRSLEFGSLLHDIGKIGVPDAILRKPGKLDEAEWREDARAPSERAENPARRRVSGRRGARRRGAPRALGRLGLSGGAARRGDRFERAHLRRRRRLRRDDERPRLPQRAAATTRRRRSWKPSAVGSSTRG